jgi:hypothetical protein
MAGTDLPGGEFIDDAKTRRTFRNHRLIAEGRYAAIAVSALIAGELDYALVGAIYRAFFRARALTPSALNRIDLRQRRPGDSTEKSKAAIVVRMPSRPAPSASKTKGVGCGCLTRRTAVNAHAP